MDKTSAIDVAEAQNKRYKNKLETLDTLLSQRTQIETQKKIKNTEKEIEALEKHRTYTFQTLLTDWIINEVSIRHPDITTVLNIAALIPQSTAAVERSLMKLISTRLRN